MQENKIYSKTHTNSTLFFQLCEKTIYYLLASWYDKLQRLSDKFLHGTTFWITKRFERAKCGEIRWGAYYHRRSCPILKYFENKFTILYKRKIFYYFKLSTFFISKTNTAVQAICIFLAPWKGLLFLFSSMETTIYRGSQISFWAKPFFFFKQTSLDRVKLYSHMWCL